MHQLFKDPFEVSKWVTTVSANLLHHCVNDCAPPSGLISPNEQPVFRAKFSRPNCVFGVVVIKLDLAVVEAGFKLFPLVEGVAQRFSQLAFGKNAAFELEVFEEFAEMVVVAPGLKPAKVGYLMSHCRAKSMPLRLLLSKAARTSSR